MRVALLAALLLRASVAFAQAPSLLYVSQAVPWDPNNTAARIDWALPFATPIPTQVTTRVDTGAWLVSTPDCDPAASGNLRWCHTMTPEIKALLDVPGFHRVQVALGLDASANLQLRTLSNLCPYVTLAGVSQPQHVGDAPLTAYRAITSAADYATYESRNAQLRSWGLAVTDHLAPINGGWTVAMQAECVWH